MQFIKKKKREKGHTFISKTQIDQAKPGRNRFSAIPQTVAVYAPQISIWFRRQGNTMGGGELSGAMKCEQGAASIIQTQPHPLECAAIHNIGQIARMHI